MAVDIRSLRLIPTQNHQIELAVSDVHKIPRVPTPSIHNNNMTKTDSNNTNTIITSILQSYIKSCDICSPPVTVSARVYRQKVVTTATNGQY